MARIKQKRVTLFINTGTRFIQFYQNYISVVCALYISDDGIKEKEWSRDWNG